LKPDGVISVRSFPSCKAESDYLAERLAEILAGINWDTLPEDRPIFLFPSRRVLGQYKKELEKRGIKCNARDSQLMLDERSWLRICARIAIQKDQPYLHRILLERHSALRRKINSIITLLVNGTTSIASALDILSQQSGWGIQSQAAAEEYKTFLRLLTSNDSELVTNSFNSVLSNNYRCTREVVENFLNNADETNLDDFIDTLISQVFDGTAQSQEDAPIQQEVDLLTMHGSKGLTRRWVFIPGFEHAWMPGNATGERLEELKRVFFVALTRATDEVSITYPRTRARGDALNFDIEGRGQPSIFANHIGVAQEYLVYRK
jgi:superfamily I DNA/RNA helicase